MERVTGKVEKGKELVGEGGGEGARKVARKLQSHSGDCLESEVVQSL